MAADEPFEGGNLPCRGIQQAVDVEVWSLGHAGCPKDEAGRVGAELRQRVVPDDPPVSQEVLPRAADDDGAVVGSGDDE